MKYKKNHFTPGLKLPDSSLPLSGKTSSKRESPKKFLILYYKFNLINNFKKIPAPSETTNMQ